MNPLIILLIGTVIVIGGIVVFRIGAFFSLIVAAIVVSLLAPGGDKIGRVAAAFGSTAGSIGIVIALAAVIGKCLMDSGAADRIVRAFLRALGEKRAATAMMGSGFVLAVPVFFDTVFYLLVPLARSMYGRLKKDYLKFILAISAGGAITHTLVPPTPGPLVIADNLGVDLGTMILVGSVVAIPSAVVGLLFAGFLERRMEVIPRGAGDAEADAGPKLEPIPDEKLPALWLSLLPVLLPVLLISANTVLTTIADGERAARLTEGDIRDWAAFRENFRGEEISPVSKRVLEFTSEWMGERLATAEPFSDWEKGSMVEALGLMLCVRDFYSEDAFLGVKLSDVSKGLLGKDRLRMRKGQVERLNRSLLEDAYPAEQLARHEWNTPRRQMAVVSGVFGNANLALLLSAVIALGLYVRQRKPGKQEFGETIEVALMSAGLIILITAGGGAFGAMLKAAEIGPAIQGLFSTDAKVAGVALLLLGFMIASLLKFAQGSSTVAMITASAMVAAMIDPDTLGFSPVYLATAIGGGSLVGSWMNDSGFWIFTKMGGLTEVQALKSWTPLLAVLGIVALVTTIVLSMMLPLV